jgi:hypothetical protein
LALPALT